MEIEKKYVNYHTDFERLIELAVKIEPDLNSKLVLVIAKDFSDYLNYRKMHLTKICSKDHLIFVDNINCIPKCKADYIKITKAADNLEYTDLLISECMPLLV